MSEKFSLTKQEHTPVETATDYFKGTAPTREFLAAKKFLEKHLTKYTGTLDTQEENLSALRTYIDTLKQPLMSDVTTDGIIKELIASGLITKPVPVKEIREPALPVEHIREHIHLDGPTHVAVSDEEHALIEANLLVTELKKSNVFRNEAELDSVYEAALALNGVRPIETLEYYTAFADAGLIKGGQEEVFRDMEALAERKQQFLDAEPSDKKQREKLHTAKKVATITEQSIAYGVSKLHWYGDTITIDPSSEFDDVKRGVDDVLEIRKPDDESSFMGLGIDVTYRGLESEQFERKVMTLLQSIADGYKTKLKYVTSHSGVQMKEFAVPKIVLHFNLNDVKELVAMVKQATHDGVEAHDGTQQKKSMMSQMLISCKKLSAVAQEYQNDIFRKYEAVSNSITELSWKNNDLKTIMENLSNEEHSPFAARLDEIIVIFKKNRTTEQLS